ncbi:beta-lactamase family protein [bacterium]|nr:beta-lactamase family protein [bacterium]
MKTETGIDDKRLSAARQLFEEGINKQLYPGGAVLASYKNEVIMQVCAGHTDFSHTAEVNENTLFDLASLTKPIATAPAVLALYQDGLVSLDQCVTEFFPERHLPHLEKVTLRHLLTHTSGLPSWRALYSNAHTRKQAIDELFAIDLEHEPGTAYTYSCLGYIMLGLVIEAVSGESMDQFVKRRLFQPMGMPNTLFNPSPTKYLCCATDHSKTRARMLVGEVHDDNAFVLGGVAGNAGLFSNILDLATFCRHITIREQLCKKIPLEDAVLKLMFQNAVPEKIGMQSVGWFMKGNEMFPGGEFVSKFAIGHSGFTGTAMVIDPACELFVILLTNRVCLDDSGMEFRKQRRSVFDAIVGAIV